MHAKAARRRLGRCPAPPGTCCHSYSSPAAAEPVWTLRRAYSGATPASVVRASRGQRRAFDWRAFSNGGWRRARRSQTSHPSHSECGAMRMACALRRRGTYRRIHRVSSWLTIRSFKFTIPRRRFTIPRVDTRDRKSEVLALATRWQALTAGAVGQELGIPCHAGALGAR
jgi:hypothetical protein